VQANFYYLWYYQAELEKLCFPPDGGASPYPFYDRWGDVWNVSAEFVILNSARSLGTLGFLAGQTAGATKAWKSPKATISVPSSVVVGSKLTASVRVPGMDLSGARVVWEANDQEPSDGATFTFSPKKSGTQWVEVEAQWPDGRRAFASAKFTAR
jgi:hypothetical protein